MKFLEIDNRFGRRLIIDYEPEFKEEIIEKISRYEGEDILIRYNDLSFKKGATLTDFKSLRFTQLNISCDPQNLPKDWEVIYEFTHLKKFWFSGLAKTNLDLSPFQNLIYLNVDWFKGLSGLENLKSLNKFFLFDYKPKTKDLSAFSNLKELHTLKLVRGNFQSINGIQNLKGLNDLQIINNNNLLMDTNIVFENIEFLTIENCKNITSDFYKCFPNLKKLLTD